MYSTSPDAFALAAFGAVAAMCEVLKQGQSLDWAAIEPKLRAIAGEIETNMTRVGNSQLQADTARLMSTLLEPPAAPP